MVNKIFHITAATTAPATVPRSPPSFPYLIHIDGLQCLSMCENNCMVLVFGLALRKKMEGVALVPQERRQPDRRQNGQKGPTLHRPLRFPIHN